MCCQSSRCGSKWSCCTSCSPAQLQDEFEATNACMYEMEKRLEERFVEVRADVSLASAECKQQTVSETVRTTKLQLDNLQDRLNSRIQGKPHCYVTCHAFSGLLVKTVSLSLCGNTPARCSASVLAVNQDFTACCADEQWTLHRLSKHSTCCAKRCWKERKMASAECVLTQHRSYCPPVLLLQVLAMLTGLNIRL